MRGWWVAGAFATILIPADQASEPEVVKLEAMTALSKVPHSARGRLGASGDISDGA